MNRADLTRIVGRVDDLPTLSRTVLKITELVNDKNENIAELKSKAGTLEKKLEALLEQRKNDQLEFRRTMINAEENHKEGMSKALLKQKESMGKAFLEEMEKARQEVTREVEQRVRAEMPPPGPDPEKLEGQIRRQLEVEMSERARQSESEVEDKVREVREGSKKEMDKIRWEAESLKEEIKKLRGARNQIEKEAQELLQQAESHYKRELDKQMSSLKKGYGGGRGLFTSIGRFLDKPLIDTGRKKEEE